MGSLVLGKEHEMSHSAEGLLPNGRVFGRASFAPNHTGYLEHARSLGLPANINLVFPQQRYAI